MGFHTYDVSRADSLEDDSRFRYCSREELLDLLGVHPEMSLLDLGSGTGFYTRELAPYVAETYALDVQAAMGRRHREEGVGDGVHLLTGAAHALPFADGALDAAYSTMTFHEYAAPDSLAEVARVLGPGGRLVTVDWSATGAGDAGPPRAERYDPGRACELLAEAGFAVERTVERVETFVSVARVVAPGPSSAR
jgi:ubiquinone/menaquinone biosynthesis C-methylase UbiE